MIELVRTFIDVMLHLNVHLAEIVANYGPWVYVLLFLVVFCETGLVVTPFLPGDSLLFAAGAIAATGDMNVALLCAVLIVAAILGDGVNFWVGSTGGYRLAQRFPRLIRPEHLARTRRFYERYGAKTIVIARFVPIVRTFAPFVAGIGKMDRQRFTTYNVGGALLWVLSLVPAGYFFANVPFVQQNFGLVILAIIALSILPAVVEIVKETYRSRKTT